ncbi:hypothetical protein BDW69DRAFT_182347 [Aspergillus filifer]
MTSNTNSNSSFSGAGTSNPQGPSKTNPASASTSASISAPASSQSQTQQPLYPGLGANFAHNPQAPGPYTVNYDQETYSQYMADEDAAALAAEAATGTGSTGPETKKTKTPKQIYREQWVRRALNPAISDPRGDPSPIDFECAENQSVRERI